MKPKRLFRISLRLLLILVTVFCVWLGAVTNKARIQSNAIKWVDAQGGWVRYAKTDGPPWWTNFAGRTVEHVAFCRKPVSDISPLGQLTDLESIMLVGTNVTDISALPKLGKLKKILLSNTPVGDWNPLLDCESLELIIVNDKQLKETAFLRDFIEVDSYDNGVIQRYGKLLPSESADKELF